MQENPNFIKFLNELEVELGQLKVDDCLNFFITKVNENKEVISNEKCIREVCYTFLGKDKIFSSISKINDQLLNKASENDKNQMWIIYYLIYYSGQLYPYLYTRLLFENILNKFVNELNQTSIHENEVTYQSILRICYKIGHLHKLCNKDLELFDEQVINTLLEFIEHTRNYHDEAVNYSIIEFLVVLSNQIENKIKNKNDKNNTIKSNNILTVLEKRINNSKTLSENLIFILNRTDDFSVKLYILKFLDLIFSTSSLDKFFYTNDIPVLLDVTLRELWNLTDEHTHLQKGYLILLERLIQYTINYNMPYRYRDIVKLLYVVSHRSEDTCYSNKIQHAKLVTLSNIAKRILNSFNSVLDVSILTPIHSNDNLPALNANASITNKEKSKKKKSSKNKQSKTDFSSPTLTPVSLEAINVDDFEKKKENGKRVNPLNQIKSKSKSKSEDDDNKEELLTKEKEALDTDKDKEEEEENEMTDKDHEGLSQKAMDMLMKSYQQYNENNLNVQKPQSAPPAIEEKLSSSSLVEEDRDHDKLSQKAMNIFMRSYQQYHESNPSSEVNTPSIKPAELEMESVSESVPSEKDNDHDKLSQKAMNIFMRSYQQYHESNPSSEVTTPSIKPAELEMESVSESVPNEEDNDHDKLSQKAMNIFMRSYQQYHESNPSSEVNTPSIKPAELEMESVSESIPNEEDNDHDKVSQKAMNIFMRSMQQYNNEQNDIQSTTLPPTYTGKENISHPQSQLQQQQQQQQETIYSANSHFSHDSTTTTVNTVLPIPTRLDSRRSDPIERTQSPFSDSYQISSQYNYDKYYGKRGKSSIPSSTISANVSSPALSDASYQSNHSSPAKPYTYYPPPKMNNIFKRENIADNNYSVSPLNYGGRKGSYSSMTNSSSSSPYSPQLNSSNNSNKTNSISNIFNMKSNIIEDPIQRHQSPFDDSFSIE